MAQELDTRHVRLNKDKPEERLFCFCRYCRARGYEQSEHAMQRKAGAGKWRYQCVRCGGRVIVFLLEDGEAASEPIDQPGGELKPFAFPMAEALRNIAGMRNVPVFGEWRFHPTRDWRFDAGMPTKKVAVEFEGGVWNQGRHVRSKGYHADMAKYNAAAMSGWMVLRYGSGPEQAAAFMRDIREVL